MPAKTKAKKTSARKKAPARKTKSTSYRKSSPSTAKCPSCGRSSSDKKTLAIVGLILNIVIWPGVGTIIGGDTKNGIIQAAVFLVSIPLSFILIGIPMLIGVWIWAIISSVKQLNSA